MEWAQDLVGRSGANMAGLNFLSPTVLKDWAELMGHAPLHPFEVEALFELDAALLTKEDETAKQEDSNLPKKTRPKWPERKPQG